MNSVQASTELPQNDPVHVLDIGQRRYRLTRLRDSSDKYGPCEVCKGFVTSVHYQVEEMYFRHSSGPQPYREGWTHADCASLFGHKECLQERRRGRHVHTMTDDKREYSVHAAPDPKTGLHD